MRNRNNIFERKVADRFPGLKHENNLGDRMIKQLLNSVITKYHGLPASRRSIICISLRLRQTIELLATDKSRYFAQPRPITVNYLSLPWAFDESGSVLLS